jgi:hypothetical protein
MTMICIAEIAENDFSEMARCVPGLLTPHAAYVAQLAWREADWKGDNSGHETLRVAVTPADISKYRQSHGKCDAHDLTTLAGLKHNGKL